MPTYLPYMSGPAANQVVLGHYSVGQLSGNIAATPTALDVHASVRWAPTLTNAKWVLIRLRLGWGVQAAVTAAVRMAYQASVVRGFTSDFATAATAINMATVPKTNSMNSLTMNSSLMGANGPRICTTAPQTTFTGTIDTAPFAMCTWVNQPSGNATVTQAIGVMGEMKTAYEWTGIGQHPVVLNLNEGIVVQLVSTGWATGVISLYTEWTWAETLTI